MQSAQRIVVVCGAGVSVNHRPTPRTFGPRMGMFRKLKRVHPQAGLSNDKVLFDARLHNTPAAKDAFHSMI